MQAKAEPDPAGTRHDQVDAEEQTEDIDAVDGPTRQDQTAEQQRDHAGQRNPDPWRFGFHAERENDPHDARYNERCTQQEREQHRREQRIVERQEAGDDVEHAEQRPEHKLAPALDLECVDHFGDACDDHHDADNENARHRRHDDAAKRPAMT